MGRQGKIGKIKMSEVIEKTKLYAIDEGEPGVTPDREDLWQFLQSNVLCTLSSLDKAGWPNAATVAFSTTPDFEFIIGTDVNSRKSQNMQNDSRVAMTITDSTQRFTVQLEGEARLIDDAEFVARYEEIHFDKLPMSRSFREVIGQCYFVIRPVHLRFSDVNSAPWTLSDFDYEALLELE